MLIERLDFLLPYGVRRLTEEDGDEIFGLQRKHAACHAMYTTREIDMDYVLGDLTSVPDGRSLADKFYLGVYDGDRLVAIVDVVLGFPLPKTAWLGMIMVDAGFTGQGIGGRILEALKHALYRENIIELYTAVPVKCRAEGFFDAHGFGTGDVERLGTREDGTVITGRIRGVSTAAG